MRNGSYLKDAAVAASQNIKERDYWLNKLSGDLQKSNFPYTFKKIGIKERRINTLKFKFSDEIFSSLMKLSNGSDYRLQIIMVAGLVLLLYKYTANKDIIVGAPVYKQDIDGELINTVLSLRNHVKGDLTFKDFLLQVAKTVFEANENQNYPIKTLLYKLNIPISDRDFPLFDIAVLLENIHDKEYLHPIKLNMIFAFLRTSESVKGVLEYNDALYERAFLKRLIDHFTNLLQRCLSDLELTISRIDILSEQERKQLIFDFNDNKADFPRHKTIYQLIEKHAETKPDCVALGFQGEHLTYRYLNERANRLAGLLRNSGIQEDALVGILLERSPLMVESIAAVWKSGGAYIPLEIHYPLRRLTEIMNDSEAKVLLTQSQYIHSTSRESLKDRIIDLDKDSQGKDTPCHSVANLDLDINMHSLAYVIYTSGSTGKPKGVMVEHIGMMNHIQAKIVDLQLTRESIIAQNAAHTFDISIWQFFTALTLGGRTVIYPHELILEPGRFISHLINDGITLLEVVPSYLSVILDTLGEQYPIPLPLDYQVVTGEEIKPHLVKQWFERYPHIRMVNAYGPTEASDDITHYIMDKACERERVPIGKPVQNFNIYIVDENALLCPIGVKGEIWVSGVGVGRGYLKDTEQTQEVFMEDPFIEEKGVMLYKTGDLGSWLPDGIIDFFGRKDYQIKIRGFRIELGEIESKLINHPGVKEVVVMDREDEEGNKYICTYLVPNGIVNVSEIQEYLSENLPDYMVPTYFVELEQMPLTPNGKIDRKALLKLDNDNTSGILYITAEMLEKVIVNTGRKSSKKNLVEEDRNREHVLSKEEMEQILYTFNDTAVEYPKDKTIHQLFEEQVEKTPNNVAVVHKGRHLTYRKLNERTNQLARLLRTMGVKANFLVGIMIERIIELVIGIIGILKAGGAYLPIDYENPEERKKYILEFGEVELLLTDNDKNLWGSVSRIVNLYREKNYRGDPSNLPLICNPKDLAYVMFTSGTTGIPKGVMIEHRSVVNLIKGVTEIINFEESDIILSVIPASFDMFGSETLLPFTKGSKVVIGTTEEQIDFCATASALKRGCITIYQVTPSHLRLLLSDETVESLKYIKYLIVAGEALPEAVKKRASEALGGKIFDLYGPTETTIFSTGRDVTGENPLNIGKPLANTRVYILSRDRKLLPIGVAGELCIEGDGVARGYLKREDLTAEKFIENPFIKGERIYTTGDLASWLPNGDIEFHGRIDHQVQIKGIRVELGEIESCLLQHRDIRESVVVAKESETGAIDLCACLVSDKKQSEEKLRKYLLNKLPLYMLPTYFVQLEKMPLTYNGKVNRRLLEALDVKASATVKYEVPRNALEQKLAEIWGQVLGRSMIGINENFFMIGGDSIKTIQIASRMNKAGYKINMRDLFENPTIAKLAPLVRTSSRISDQSVVSGIVPLTPIQKIFFEESHIELHHFNQALILYSKERLEEKAVRAIFSKLQEHHDALRMTYKRNENGEIIQTNHGLDYPLSLQEYDLRNKDAEHAKKSIEASANEIQASIYLENGPLMKLGLFHLTDGDRLLIVIHHLVIDGVSWRILFEDIDALYRQYKRGEALVLPLKTDSFKTWSERILEYANNEKFLKEKSYWAELESSMEEKCISQIEKDFKTDDSRIKDTEYQSFRLSESDTTLLLTKVNGAFNTEINDILLTAFGLGIKKVYGIDHLLVALEGHGREEILEGVDITRTVGWFTSIYPVLLDFFYATDEVSTENLSRQIKEIKETLRRVPRKGVGYSILKYLTAETHKKEINFLLKSQILFNYLGQFKTDVGQMSFGIAEESPGNTRNPEASRKYELDVSGMIADSQLIMTIGYSKKQFKWESIEKLLNSFQSQLIRLISFCSGKEVREFTPSDFIYPGLSIETVDQLQKQYQIDDIYTLTPLQEGMLFHALYENTSSAYYSQTSYRVHGEWDISFIEKSLNELVKRYDILRTVFIYKDLDRPVQMVLKERQMDFWYEDLRSSGRTDTENEKFIEAFKENDRKCLFDLSKDVLMRVAVLQVDDKEYEFVWSSHHILMDGWCVGILISDFFKIYNSFLQNKTLQLPKVTPYRNYIEWLEKQNKESSKDYWKKYLDGYEEFASLPGKKLVKAREAEFINRCVDFTIKREKTIELSKLAARNQVTLNTVMQVAWGIILERYSGKEDVVFGAVVSGRPSEVAGVESMVGLFLNTVPVRIKYDQRTRFSGLLKRVQEAAVRSEPHHYYPLAEIQSESIPKQSLLDHFLVFENYPIGEQIDGLMTGNQKDNEGLVFELSNVQFFMHTNYDFSVVIFPGDELTIRFEYNVNAYEKELTDQVGNCFCRVLHLISLDEHIEIGELEFVSEEKKAEIISHLNDGLKDEVNQIRLTKETFQDKLNESLTRYRDKVAIEYGNKVISYNGLDRRSNYIANWIVEQGIGSKTFIGVLADDRIELISAILGVLKAGCVFIPLDTTYPNSRLEVMIKSVNVKLIFMDLLNADRFDSNRVGNYNAEFIQVDHLFLKEEHSWFHKKPFIEYNTEDKVYLYYTSGTTGIPKAILGKNQSLLHFIDWEVDTFNITEDFRITQFTRPGFDPFLRDIFVTLCSGAVICIPENNDIMLNPDELMKWIDKHRIHIVRCIPSLFRLLNSAALNKNNFKELKFVLLSGEKINPSDLKNWYDIFGERIQLVNLYGPTESTLVKVYYLIKKTDVNRERIPIGKPIKGSRVVIIDEKMKICDELVKGEICISTPFLSLGYCNDPELNIDKFIQNSFSNNPNDTLYRTGDLGQLLFNGCIDIIGRMDRQVKIRGYRIELEEIESALVNHPFVKEAVVIKKEISYDNEILSAFITINEEDVRAEESLIYDLKEYLSEKLPSYMVPTHIIRIDEIPRKPNGKIDYRGISNHFKNKDIDYIPPGDNIEKKLLEIWEKILRVEKFGVTNNFFGLGGNSLNVMSLINEIHRVFDIRLSLGEIFNNLTIEKQARIIKAARKNKYMPIKPVEEKGYYALSSAQKRLYILQQMDLKSTAYNISQTVELEGELEREILEETLKKVIRRHESLRTSFHMVGKEPVQKTHNDVEFAIEYYDMKGIEAKGKNSSRSEVIIQNFIRPFDLSLAPLLRVGLIKKAKTEHILMVDIHHIISDGTSIAILVNEFIAYYRGKELPPLSLRYRDYSEWQNKSMESKNMKKQEIYWLKQFEDKIPELNMLTDYARPEVQSFEGDSISFTLGEDLSKQLKQLAKKTETTLYIILLAVYNILLSKYNGREDITVGCGIAGRNHADLKNIIGMFVNMLAMRNRPEKNKTFGDFLKEVKENTLNAFENQDYQFDELVKKSGLDRIFSRNPLFDTQFTFQNIDVEADIGEMEVLKPKAHRYIKTKMPFDLSLNANDSGETIEMTLSYLTSLFKSITVGKITKHYIEILEQVIGNGDITIKDIQISHGLSAAKSYFSQKEYNAFDL